MTSIPWQLIDSHAHLDFYTLQERPAVLQGMREANTQAISIGTESKNWQKIADIAAENPDVMAGYTVGLHPGHVGENWREEIAVLEEFLQKNKPTGIGECGLDYFRLKETPNAVDVVAWQKAAFDAQLDIIKQNNLPVVIHARGEGAYVDILTAIERSGNDWRRFVFHCFSEGAKEIRELNARGARGSFTGIITFKNGQQMREALLAQPPELLMVETDAPFLAPEPLRGKQNTPANVHLVGKKAAELLGVEADSLLPQIFKTTIDFWGLADRGSK